MAWWWARRRVGRIGDPRAPEVIGYPGIHEPSRGHRRDAPLSESGRVVFFGILAVIAVGFAFLVILTK